MILEIQHCITFIRSRQDIPVQIDELLLGFSAQTRHASTHTHKDTQNKPVYFLSAFVFLCTSTSDGTMSELLQKSQNWYYRKRKHKIMSDDDSQKKKYTKSYVRLKQMALIHTLQIASRNPETQIIRCYRDVSLLDRD